MFSPSKMLYVHRVWRLAHAMVLSCWFTSSVVRKTFFLSNNISTLLVNPLSPKVVYLLSRYQIGLGFQNPKHHRNYSHLLAWSWKVGFVKSLLSLSQNISIFIFLWMNYYKYKHLYIMIIAFITNLVILFLSCRSL